MTSLEKKIDGMEREKLEIDHSGPYNLKLMNSDCLKQIRSNPLRFTKEEIKKMGKEANRLIKNIERECKSPIDYVAEVIVYGSLIGVTLGLGLIVYDSFFR